MQIVNYRQAIQYLESFIGKIRFRIDPEFLKHHDPLERMRVLLSLLGNPQDKFHSILIGGTAGKGSTAYLISHILTTAGYKTGLTISPHLQKINERMQIDGKPISDQEFTQMVGSMVQIIEPMERMEAGLPSYFEILIGMAFLYFAQSKVDIAVVEVGMGGEFDATNTLYPLVAVLTNVSLDHTNVLGGTVQKIARTKAGIIKKYQISPIRQAQGKNIKYQINTNKENLKRPIVISGVRQPSVIKIVEDRCKEVGAEVFRLHKDFKFNPPSRKSPIVRSRDAETFSASADFSSDEAYGKNPRPLGRGSFKIKEESLKGTIFDLIIFSDRRKELNNILLSLLGKHQVENASLAIATVLQLQKFGFKISEEQVRQALKTAFFPGRFEVINYTLVLDGAHNPTKMRAFLSTLKKLYLKNPKIFVVAFKSDKDIKGMLRQILEVADTLIVTEFRVKTDMSVHASADALNLKSQISKLKTNMGITVEKDSEKALEEAIKISKSETNSIIVVTGSLYLVGEVRSYLLRNPKLQITNPK